MRFRHEGRAQHEERDDNQQRKRNPVDIVHF
jgi:hypothetical protein